MSQDKSPAGTFPTFPQKLWVDGEAVNEDTLCVSATADRGTFGKLIDAVGFLRDVVGYTALVTTDGAGNATVNWQSNRNDGSDWISSVTVSSTGLTVNIADTFADRSTYAVEVQRQTHSTELASTFRFPHIAKNTTAFVVQLIADDAAVADPSANIFRYFIRLTKAAAL